MDRAPDAVTPEALLAEAPWVRRLAGALVGDPAFADDVAQETLRRGLEHPPSSRAGLRGWLATVARNVVRSRWRTDRRRTGRERAVARPEGGVPVDDVVARAEEHRRVVEAVLTLEEPYRSTILHRYFDDLGPSAIADRTGTPVDTVRTRLHRALGQLRGRLEAEHGGDPAATRRALLALMGPVGGIQATAAPARDSASTTAIAAMAPTLRMVPWVAAIAVLAVGATLIFKSDDEAPKPSGAATSVATAAPDGDGPADPGRVGERDGATRLAAGGAPAARGGASDRPTAVRIQGVVLDEQGAPVPGVLVVSRSPIATQPPSGDVHPLRTQRLQALSPPSPPAPPSGRAISDATGRFDLAIADMPPAGYVVLTAMPAAPVVGSTRNWAPARDEDVTLRVAAGAPLRGRLLDPEGRGIAGTVTLERRVPGETDPWRWTGLTSAGEGGRFTLDAAPLGILSFAVKAPGRLAVTGRIVEHRSGEEMLLTIGGAPGATVAGAVTDGAGAPVPNADVLLYTRAAGAQNEWLNVVARTGGDGTYKVEGLPACILSALLVDAEGFAPVYSLRNTSVAAGATDRWDVRLVRGATLEGRVLGEDGTPIERATFTLRQPGIFPPPTPRSARTNAGGRFTVEGIAPGEVEWRVRAEGWYDPIGEALLPDANRVDAVGRKLRFEREGERKSLEVRMKRGIPVIGAVVDAAGRPIADAKVVVSYEKRHGEDDTGTGPTYRTEADGRFAFAGLVPGRNARLRASTPQARTASDLTILDGAGPRDVVLRLVPTGRIVGRVVDERGAGIAGVQVGRDGIPPGQFTDAAGAFRLSDVPEGPHEVHLLDGGSQPRGERVPVTVAAGGDASEVVIRVPDATRLGGVVVDEAGVPVAGSAVNVMPLAHDGGNYVTTTDAKGGFEFLGMTPGTYRFQFYGANETTLVTTGSLDLRLVKKTDRSRTLSGTIVDAEGRPVPSVRLAVGFRTPQGKEWHRHPVGAGRFEIAVSTTETTVMVEVYDARDESGRALPLRPWRGERIDLGTPLAIRLEGGRRLEGRVLDAKGAPVEAAELTVASQGTAAEAALWTAPTPTTRTDTEGRFVFEGLLEGPIALTVKTGAGGMAIPNATVAPGESMVEIHLPTSTSVSGRVLDDRGRPLPGVEVSGDSEHRYPGRWSTTTDAEGRFRMENLPASAEKIRVWLPTPSGRGADWPWLADHAVEAKPGANEVVVRLERGVFVEGVLVDGSGRPTAGRIVALAEVPAGLPKGLFPGRVIAGSWPVEADTGRFTAGPVRPGVLRLVGEGAGSNSDSDPVEVTAPAHGVRIALRPGVVLEVRAKGEGAPGAHVTFTPDDPTAPGGQGNLDGTGAASIARLSDVPGHLVVRARDGPGCATRRIERPSAGPFELVLERGLSISGRVSGLTDELVRQGAFVYAVRRGAPALSVLAKIDGEGRFEAVALLPGTYDVRCGDGAPVVVEAGATGVALVSRR